MYNVSWESAWAIIRAEFPFALWETLYATVLATALAIVIGLPLGVLLAAGEKDGVRPLPRWLLHALNLIVNILRSVPFIIMMVLVIPLTRLLLGKAYGTMASVVPLVIAACPFVARLVESSLRAVDKNLVEAARSMGASPMRIIGKVLLSEARSGMVLSITVLTIGLLSYSAAAGMIGGGGLGDLAVRYGYHRFQTDVMIFIVTVLVLAVIVIQSAGNRIARKLDKR